MSEDASRILIRYKQRKAVKRCNNCRYFYDQRHALFGFASITDLWCLMFGKKVNPGWYGCGFHAWRRNATLAST